MTSTCDAYPLGVRVSMLTCVDLEASRRGSDALVTPAFEVVGKSAIT